jgi:hypothetical protein
VDSKVADETRAALTPEQKASAQATYPMVDAQGIDTALLPAGTFAVPAYLRVLRLWRSVGNGG